MPLLPPSWLSSPFQVGAVLFCRGRFPSVACTYELNMRQEHPVRLRTELTDKFSSNRCSHGCGFALKGPG